MAQAFAQPSFSRDALFVAGGATILKDRNHNSNLYTEKQDALDATNALETANAKQYRPLIELCLWIERNVLSVVVASNPAPLVLFQRLENS